METPVDSCDNADIVEDVVNVKSHEINSFESCSLAEQTSHSFTNMHSPEKLQKTQLPNTSFDDSPFVNLRSSKLRKKKTQSKLTYLKLPGTTSKKNKNATISKSHDSENNVKSQKLKNVCTTSFEASTDSSEVPVSDCGGQQQNSFLVCPVCWKKFETSSSHLAHMKICATKHNLTLKQMLDALDLQTKQIEERKILGLPSVPTITVAKKTISKKNSRANDGSDPDLQLGLALSVSMKESEEQKQLAEEEIMIEAGLGDEVAANQASLLERFGFTSTRPVLSSIHSRSRPGKQKLKGTPLLLLRSQEERERLITEKVAIILTSEEENRSLSLVLYNDLISPGFQLKSEVLSQLKNKETSWWKKASASPCSTDHEVYYIEPLSHVITPSKVAVGSKLKHLSQVPCRLKTPVRHSSTAAENFNDYIAHGKREISLNEYDLQNIEHIDVSRCENVHENTDVLPMVTDTKTENSLCKFVHELANNWKTLLSSKNRSDLRIHVKDGHEIPVHELVLFVRCPNVLHDVIQETSDTNECMKYLVWNEVSFKCASAFLDFIYCGSTCKISELTDNLDEIKFLSRKYDVKELCSYLKIADESEEISLQYPCRESDNKSSGFIEAKGERTEEFKQYSAQISNVASLYPTCIKNSKDRTSSPSKSEENDVADDSNRDGTDNISECISHKKNDLPNKSCASPDPFCDSDQEINSIHFSKKDSSSSSQQNMVYLLKALDEHKHSNNNCKIPADNSETCNSVSSVGKHNEQNISITEKRKLADSTDVSDTKRICMSNRKSVRKSLLSRFSDEMGDAAESEKTMKYEMSQSSSDSDSVTVIESIETNSKKNNYFLHEDECIEVLTPKQDESGDGLSSCRIGKLTSESEGVPIASIGEKLHDSVNREDEMCMDALGDYCADYEYQNFHANFSPYGQLTPEIKCKNENVKEKLGVTEYTRNADIDKSPFSSSTSVNSLSTGHSPGLSGNKVQTKHILRKVKSSTNISVNNDSCAFSPISVKCLSQTSIHLKTSHEISIEESKRRNMHLMDPKSSGEINISSEIALGTPVTPYCQIPKTPNRSIKSLKRLLEDSFTDEMARNQCFFISDFETLPCSTPVATASVLSTKKLKDVLHEENCVTPMANYSTMDTPGLKKELQKYGLKPLKRKQAKQILRHIYDELHPLVPAQTNGDEVCKRSVQSVSTLACSRRQSLEELVKSKSPKTKHSSQKLDMSTMKLTEETDISSENDSSLPSTQESSSSTQCEYEIQEEMTGDCALTQTDVSELPSVVNSYITNNPVLYQQVLLFEPIWLEQLQDALKAQNYKFKLENLMEYLDEECITFRIAQGNKSKKRQRRKETQ